MGGRARAVVVMQVSGAEAPLLRRPDSLSGSISRLPRGYKSGEALPSVRAIESRCFIVINDGFRPVEKLKPIKRLEAANDHDTSGTLSSHTLLNISSAAPKPAACSIRLQSVLSAPLPYLSEDAKLMSITFAPTPIPIHHQCCHCSRSIIHRA